MQSKSKMVNGQPFRPLTKKVHRLIAYHCFPKFYSIIKKSIFFWICFLTWTSLWSQPKASRAYTVGDILLTTKWSQHGVYKSKTPIVIYDASIHVRLGCWTVAIAQIINYHQLQSTGSTSSYLCSCDTICPNPIRKNNLDAFTYDWNCCWDIVKCDDPDSVKKNVSTLCYDVATVIQKDFGTFWYVLNEQEMIAALRNHFPGISSETRWDEDLTPDEIKKEIDLFQPIMFYILGQDESSKNTRPKLDDSGKAAHAEVIDGYRYNNSVFKDTKAKSDDSGKTAHAVVIDGYRYQNSVFQVHLNYGWGGKNNGWYNYNGSFRGESGTTKDDYDITSHREGMLISLINASRIDMFR